MHKLGMYMAVNQRFEERLEAHKKVEEYFAKNICFLEDENGDVIYGKYVVNQKNERKLVEATEFEKGAFAMKLEPIEQVAKLKEKVMLFSAALHQSAIPYGRGGDKDENKYIEYITAWEPYFAIHLEYIQGVQSDLDGKTMIDQENLVRKLEGFVNIGVINYGKILDTLSWKDVDISPQVAISVMAQPQPQQQQWGGSTRDHPRELPEESARKENAQNWGKPQE